MWHWFCQVKLKPSLSLPTLGITIRQCPAIFSEEWSMFSRSPTTDQRTDFRYIWHNQVSDHLGLWKCYNFESVKITWYYVYYEKLSGRETAKDLPYDNELPSTRQKYIHCDYNQLICVKSVDFTYFFSLFLKSLFFNVRLPLYKLRCLPFPWHSDTYSTLVLLNKWIVMPGAF